MNNQFKIIQLVQHFQAGGLEKMVIDLFKTSRYGKQTLLVALEGTVEQAINNMPELAEYRSQIICLNKPNRTSVRSVWKLYQLLRQYQIKVVHSHHVGPLFYASMANSLNLNKSHHISTLHDAWYLQNAKACSITQISADIGKVEFIADAAAVAQAFNQALGNTQKSPKVILNGIDSKRFIPANKHLARNNLALPQDKILIGCAARLAQGKGQDKLIQQLAFAPKEFELVLAGEGEFKQELLELAQEFDVTERIHWLGYMPDTAQFYQAIDIFSLFSQKEGLPLSILEALASGVPVVATDVGGVAEVLSEQNSILLKPYDDTLLISAWMQAHQLLQTKSASGIRKSMLASGHLKHMVSHYDNLFTQAFAG